MSEIIGVTGATGHLGRRVVRHLAAAGTRLRQVLRDPARAPRADGSEIAIAAYEDVAAMQAAFAGIRTAFLVSGHEHPARLNLHKSAIRGLVAAGVERVVYTSFMGAAPNATFTYARDHAATERAIVDAGLRLTALRDTLYADVVPYFVGADGVIRGPAGNGRIAWVAREDVARLAAAVLLDDSHADRIYDVSGPEPIDLYETAHLLSNVTGRTISYRAETIEEARASRAGAGEPWQIEGWLSSYHAIATGEAGVSSHTIEYVTGRRPWSFADFLRNEPDTWAHLLR